MSIDSTIIHCTGCDYTHTENYQPITLKCRFGSSVISYYRSSCWCYECNGITYAEHLPDMEEIKAEYREYYGIPGPAAHGLKRILRRFDRCYQQGLRELDNKIAWRKARTASPHCLKCGTTNLMMLEFRQTSDHTAVAEGFRHSCGGMLAHDYNHMAGIRFNFAEKEIWVDIEGNILD